MKTSADPQTYGQMVADLCFPDILRYKVGTPAFLALRFATGEHFQTTRQR